MSRNNQYRYPGLWPYSEAEIDQATFFGRDDEIDSLFNRLRATSLLILFGKSGLGKTSLICAGLIPRLRKQGNFPIPVRIGKIRENESLVDLVSTVASEYSKENDIDFSVGQGDTLWEFFSTSLFWHGDELLTPVLVFDQFEEIFTLITTKRREEIAQEIGALTSGFAPESVIEKRRNSPTLQHVHNDIPDAKILLSLREEYVGALEELSNDIPGLFQDRYRLLPLSDQMAIEAIQKPAALTQVETMDGNQIAFSNAPFKFEENTLNEILDVLKGKSGTIETPQLQILCQYFEQQIDKPKNNGEVTIINSSDYHGKTGLQRLFKSFYQNKINMLPLTDRRHAHNLFEMGLLTADGHRRMLTESEIVDSYHLKKTSLSFLVDQRLLRCEKHYEGIFYEISHDNLVQPILDSRSTWHRLPKKIRLGMPVLLALMITFIGLQQYYASELETTRDSAESLVSFLIGNNLFKQLNRIGDIDIIEQVQTQVNNHYQKIDREFKNNIFLRNHAIAYRNDGDLKRTLGNLQEARFNYRKSEEIFKQLIDNKDQSDQTQREMAATLIHDARAMIDQGKLSGALTKLEKGIEILSSLQKKLLGDVSITADLIEVYNEKAKVLLHQHALLKANETISRSILLLQAQANTSKERLWQILDLKVKITKARIDDLQNEREKNSKPYLLKVADISNFYKQIVFDTNRLVTNDPLDSEAAYLFVMSRYYFIKFSNRAMYEIMSKWKKENPITTLIELYMDLVDVAVNTQHKMSDLSKSENRNLLTKRRLAQINIAAADMYLKVYLMLATVSKNVQDESLKQKLNKRIDLLYLNATRLYLDSTTALKTLTETDSSNLTWKVSLAEAQMSLGQFYEFNKILDKSSELYQQAKETMEYLHRLDPDNIDWHYLLIDTFYQSYPLETSPEAKKVDLTRALRLLSDLKEKNLLSFHQFKMINTIEQELKGLNKEGNLM